MNLHYYPLIIGLLIPNNLAININKFYETSKDAERDPDYKFSPPGPIVTHEHPPDFKRHFDYMWPYNSSDVGLAAERVYSHPTIEGQYTTYDSHSKGESTTEKNHEAYVFDAILPPELRDDMEYAKKYSHIPAKKTEQKE